MSKIKKTNVTLLDGSYFVDSFKHKKEFRYHELQKLNSEMEEVLKAFKECRYNYSDSNRLHLLDELIDIQQSAETIKTLYFTDEELQKGNSTNINKNLLRIMKKNGGKIRKVGE